MEPEPHSHNYRSLTLQLCRNTVVKAVGSVSFAQVDKKNLVEHRKLVLMSKIEQWLNENTDLSTRTKKEYGKIIQVKALKELTWS